MAKITIDTITSGYNLSKINVALQAIVDELNDKVLYRDNPVGEPNEMSNDLDMNSNDILNVESLECQSLLINGASIGDAAASAESWAIEPEDTPVSVANGGDGTSTYSALHWAAKGLALSTSSDMAVYEYTATSGQTFFTGADDNANVLAYTDGSTIITLNGSVLSSGDYTATDGVSVQVLAATTGDILQVTAFTEFALTSSYTKPEINGGVSITPDINGGSIADVTVDGDFTANSETVTPTQVGYLNDVTADIQGQLDGKAAVAVPAAASNVAALDVNGDLEDSGVTSTELAILDGATVSTAELNYVGGATSSLQDQIDGIVAGMLHVRDEKTSGTHGGTFTKDIQQTRTLNTVLTNQISGAALSSNQITLPAGTYFIDATSPGDQVDNHKARLYDITNSATLIVGTSEDTSSTQGTTRSMVKGFITLVGSTVTELQHFCQTTHNTEGFGAATSSGDVEVYAEIIIRKMS